MEKYEITTVITPGWFLIESYDNHISAFYKAKARMYQGNAHWVTIRKYVFEGGKWVLDREGKVKKTARRVSWERSRAVK